MIISENICIIKSAWNYTDLLDNSSTHKNLYHDKSLQLGHNKGLESWILKDLLLNMLKSLNAVGGHNIDLTELSNLVIFTYFI